MHLFLHFAIPIYEIQISIIDNKNTNLHLVCGCQCQSTGHQETHSFPALFDEWFHYQVSKSQRHT